MSSALDLHGVYVPLITPFTAADEVAYDEIERIGHKAIDEGAAGLVAFGTTGEPATVEADERARVLEVIAGVCRERSAHFSVGTGTYNTRESLALQEQAVAAGAQSVLSVVPYYTRPSEAGIVEHFQYLAQNCAVPLIIYNVPYRTGRNLGADALLQLSRTPNIAGVKQAVGGVDADTARVLAEKADDFHVLCGDDAFIYPLMAMGAAGAISAPSHLLTRHFVAMVDAALKGDFRVSREIHEALLPACIALFAEPNPSVIKGVLAELGEIAHNGLRMPMTAASPAAITAASVAVAEAAARLS